MEASSNCSTILKTASTCPGFKLYIPAYTPFVPIESGSGSRRSKWLHTLEQICQLSVFSDMDRTNMDHLEEDHHQLILIRHKYRTRPGGFSVLLCGFDIIRVVACQIQIFVNHESIQFHRANIAMDANGITVFYQFNLIK